MLIGVLGLGSIGTRHANNLRTLGHLVVGADTDPKKLLAFNGDTGFSEVRVADAVVIASPTKQHYRDLMNYIPKPVFIEKPIAASFHEWHCLHLHPDSKRIFVGNNLRFHSCVLKAKEWLPRIGTPLWASFTVAQYTDKPPYLRDGVLLNWGSHEIDLALHLLGPAEVVAASARFTDGNDDIADVMLVHASKCRTAIHMDYVTKDEIRGGWIVGDQGQMSFDLVKRTVQLWGKDFFQGTDTWDENYLAEMIAWIGRIEGKDTVGATGEEGLAALEICLEAKQMAMK